MDIHGITHTMRLRLIPAVIALMAVATACSDDNPASSVRPIGVSTGEISGFKYTGFSRAEGTEPDPESEEALMPATLGVYATYEGGAESVFDNRTFYYKLSDEYSGYASEVDWQWPENFAWPADNDWPYAHLEYWDYLSRYHFFAYAPHNSVTGAGVEMRSLAYGAMDEFRYFNLPAYSALDYTVSAGRVEVDGGTEPTFTMRHIAGRVCMRVKIGEQYSQLRRIRIKSITVNDVAYSPYYRCDVDLNTGALTTSTYGYYAPSDPTIDINPVFDDPDGLLLSAEKYQQFGSLYVMPQTLSSLTINVVYDVYDLYSDSPTRKDQYITNTVNLNENIESGKYYNVDILVSPRFLYVLSDNDVPPDWLMEVE